MYNLSCLSNLKQDKAFDYRDTLPADDSDLIDITFNELLRMKQKEFQRRYPDYYPEIEKNYKLLAGCGITSESHVKVVCDECGHVFVKNTCGRYFCPQCEKRISSKWKSDTRCLLLPEQHSFITVTIPEQLHEWFRSDIRRSANMMFYAYKKSLDKIVKVSLGKKLKTGIISLLHTWNSKENLFNLHPHIHSIVLSGGIDEFGNFEQIEFNHYKDCLSELFQKILVKDIRRDDHYRDRYSLYQAENNSWYSYIENITYIEPVLDYMNKGLFLSKYDLKYDELKDSVYFISKSNNPIETFNDYNPDGMHSLELIYKYFGHILPLKIKRIKNYGIYHSDNTNNKIRNKLLTKSYGGKLDILKSVDKTKNTGNCPLCKKGYLHYDRWR